MIGLPSLGQMDRSATVRIWLAVTPADMRCGFDRLAELARSVSRCKMRWLSISRQPTGRCRGINNGRSVSPSAARLGRRGLR